MSTLIMWQAENNSQTFSIRVDATVAETHSFVNTVTDHPVERGAAITDHVRPDPVRISISGMISNHPHYLPEDHVGGSEEDYQLVDVATPGIARIFPITAASDPVRAITSGFRAPPNAAVMSRFQAGYYASAKVRTFTLSFDRVRAVFDSMTDLRDKGTLLRVETSLRTYDDMVIESFSVPRDANVGEALVFDLALKQVRTVEFKTVVVAKHKGQVSKKVVTAPEQEAADNTVLGFLVDKVTK